MGSVLVWVGFFLALGVLVIMARRRLALAMLLAAVVLAAFTLSPEDIGRAFWQTAADPSVLLLSFVVGVIPLIGGVMEMSGEMEKLVQNLRIGIRPFLALGPALLGMLPMPGGALLSAPLIERGAGHTANDVKAAANVWFRHVLLLVYPLGPSLIASVTIAKLDVYTVIPAMLPAFALCIATGYLFLLRRASGSLRQSGRFSAAGLLVPLGVILAAPAIDLTLQRTVVLPYPEVSTSVGVLVSLAVAMWVGRTRPDSLPRIVRRMKPWKYSLIILAMFAFLNVFTASGLPETIGALRLPPVVLLVGIGFALGLITGRIQAPMSILVPIYLSSHGSVSPVAFAVAYFAVFLGYILTPIHPCVSVTLQYFDTTLRKFTARLTLPAVIGLAVTSILGLWLLR